MKDVFLIKIAIQGGRKQVRFVGRFSFLRVSSYMLTACREHKK